MTDSTDRNAFFADGEQAQAELRDGFENSREMVRQSHQLIELSESMRADQEDSTAY